MMSAEDVDTDVHEGKSRRATKMTVKDDEERNDERNREDGK